MQYDVVIIGTGPAGVSAAWPLVLSGQRVLLVDASDTVAPNPPDGEYVSLRRKDESQRNWMFGRDLSRWIGETETSPKLRVPTLRNVFDGFADANGIKTENFAAIGSLESGGLSNAWGCGVARYGDGDLPGLPFALSSLNASFETVSRRIGISGYSDDSLKGYFGLDDWADVAPPLDDNAARLLERYNSGPSDSLHQRLQLGRARLALLRTDNNERLGCNLSGLCLWGCARGALYSAAHDIPQLVRAGAHHRKGVVVHDIELKDRILHIHGIERRSGTAVAIDTQKTILAAGTLASTAIALRSLRLYGNPIRLLSNPTAAFVLLRLAWPVSPRAWTPGFAQLSFRHQSESGVDTHGALFAPSRLPAFEFIKRIPTSRSAARLLWRVLATSTMVGNVFLPSKLTRHRATLVQNGQLHIWGQTQDCAEAVIADLARDWRKMARQLGYVILPGSFRLGQTGADIHYAGTLPMRNQPQPGETSATGELQGLPGVYVVDASIFPDLPAKPHTLTMMAIADHIARAMVSEKN